MTQSPGSHPCSPSVPYSFCCGRMWERGKSVCGGCSWASWDVAEHCMLWLLATMHFPATHWSSFSKLLADLLTCLARSSCWVGAARAAVAAAPPSALRPLLQARTTPAQDKRPQTAPHDMIYIMNNSRCRRPSEALPSGRAGELVDLHGKQGLPKPSRPHAGSSQTAPPFTRTRCRPCVPTA